MEPVFLALLGPGAGEFSHAWRRRAQLRAQVEQLGAKLSELRSSHAAASERHGMELARLQQAVAQDGEAVAKLESEYTAAAGRQQELEPIMASTLRRTVHVLSGKATSVTALASEVARLAKELPRLEAKLTAARTRLANHAADLRRTAAPLDSTQFAIDRLSADHVRLTAEIAACEGTMDRALWAVARETTLPVMGARLAALPAPMAAATLTPLLRLRQVLTMLAIGAELAPPTVAVPPPRDPLAMVTAAVEESAEARFADVKGTLRVEGEGTIAVRRSRRVRRGGEWRTEHYRVDVPVRFYGPVAAKFRLIWERLNPQPLGQALAAQWAEGVAHAYAQPLLAWRRERLEPLTAEAARLTAELREALGMG